MVPFSLLSGAAPALVKAAPAWPETVRSLVVFASFSAGSISNAVYMAAAAVRAPLSPSAAF